MQLHYYSISCSPFLTHTNTIWSSRNNNSEKFNFSYQLSRSFFCWPQNQWMSSSPRLIVMPLCACVWWRNVMSWWATISAKQETGLLRRRRGGMISVRNTSCPTMWLNCKKRKRGSTFQIRSVRCFLYSYNNYYDNEGRSVGGQRGSLCIWCMLKRIRGRINKVKERERERRSQGRFCEKKKVKVTL